jgi:hypothetical protein
MKTKTFIIMMSVLSFCLATSSASAYQYGFSSITYNNPHDAHTGETSLFVDVLEYGDDQVLFRFSNTGPEDSAIRAVYFDGVEQWLASPSIVAQASRTAAQGGVLFVAGASPPNLPGGELVGFDALDGFSAVARPPAPKYGVGPNEYLEIVFDLKEGTDFADVVAGLEDGTARIGLNVLAFKGGGGGSFVNVAHVPIPTAGLLFASGLCLLAGGFWWKLRT